MSALDNAWRIHAAQTDWTGKVDTKASFALALSSAALGTTVALSASGRTFSHVSGWAENALYWSGLGAILAGAFCALLVVVPRLRHTSVDAEASANYIYFGHLRLWNVDDLVAELTEGEILPVVARQAVVMAKIAWRKHRWVQRSMILTASGIGLLVATGLSATM